MSITQAKTTQYKALLTANEKNALTPTQFYLATKADTIKMVEAQAGGDGSTNTVLGTLLTWVKNNPLAVEFLTSPSVAETNFQNIISGNVTWTTAACGLPQTYIDLHAEDRTKEPALAGLLALRNAGLGTGSGTGVDSTFETDGANLGAGAAGTALTDAYVMGLYATWGASKFNAIFNNGTMKAISNESNASYDTIGEVEALYSAWAHTVPVDTFFNALNKMVTAGVSGIKVSDLIAFADNATDFNLYTSNAAATLMASTGGSFAAVTALSDAAFTALTSPNAIKAINDAGATYTLLNAVYTADTTKFNSLLSNNSVTLASKGYAGIDLPGLSTAYGTTYTAAADSKFNLIVAPANHPMFANGVTYAHMGDVYTAGKLHSFTPEIQKVLESDPSNYDANVAVLVGTLADYSGLETLGFQ